MKIIKLNYNQAVTFTNLNYKYKGMLLSLGLTEVFLNNFGGKSYQSIF